MLGTAHGYTIITTGRNKPGQPKREEQEKHRWGEVLRSGSASLGRRDVPISSDRSMFMEGTRVRLRQGPEDGTWRRESRKQEYGRPHRDVEVDKDYSS